MTVSEQRPDDREKSFGEVSFLTRFIATGMFSGYVPWASGTFGSAVGILLYLIPGAESPPALILMIIAGFFSGVIAAGKVAHVEGHRLTKSAALAKAAFQSGGGHTADPSIVVIDEIVGMWIALLWLPKTPLAIAASFVAFRVFDILKPEPARALEEIPDGWGIMLDDVVAGVYTNVTVHVILLGLQWLMPFSPP